MSLDSDEEMQLAFDLSRRHFAGTEEYRLAASEGRREVKARRSSTDWRRPAGPLVSAAVEEEEQEDMQRAIAGLFMLWIRRGFGENAVVGNGLARQTAAACLARGSATFCLACLGCLGSRLADHSGTAFGGMQSR